MELTRARAVDGRRGSAPGRAAADVPGGAPGHARARRRRAPVAGAASTALLLFFTGTVRHAAASDVVVSPQQTEQRIDGFGASSAWTAQALSAADADLVFSPDKGVGQSLLRVRMAPDGTCLEVVTAQEAQARGAKVWATPWSPPAAWKTSGNVNDGGLLPAHADDWANAMVSFVQYMRSNGVDLVGLSAQNEPDFRCTNYECCSYTTQELDSFIAGHLGPAFADAGLLDSGTAPFSLIAPETEGWMDFPRFSSAVLGDTTGSPFVGTFATHEYNGLPAADPQANQAVAAAGKAFWETEISDTKSVGADPGMGSALVVAQLINDALVQANVNAWHYWWLRPNLGTSDNSALWDNTAGWTKRLYVMGNYSRFVRPGYYRVGATATPNQNVSVTAFYESPSGTPPLKLVIVAINGGTSAVTQSFLFNGVTTASDQWAAWVTSAGSDVLSPAPNAPTLAGAALSYVLAPQSVTTLTGVVTGPGPAVSFDAGASSASGSPTAVTPVGSAPRGPPSSGLACSAAGGR